MHHILKTDPAVFHAVIEGTKTYEIRFNDRGFAVGDVLQLLETTSTGAEIAAGAALVYTGREVTKTVSHVLGGYGLAEGWVILSFAGANAAFAPGLITPVLASLQSILEAEILSAEDGERRERFLEKIVVALTAYAGASIAAHREASPQAVDEGGALFRTPMKAAAPAAALECIAPEAGSEEPMLHLAIAHAEQVLPVGHHITIEVQRGRSTVDWDGSPAGLVFMNGCGSLANAVREATRAAIEAKPS